MAADRRRSRAARVRARAARVRARAGTVRVRTTVAATVVVAVAMTAAAVLLLAVLRVNLTREVGDGARSRAAGVAAVLASGIRPGQVAIDDAQDQVIQVLDATGRVVASSPNVAGSPAVARLRPGQTARIDVPVDNEGFLAVAVAANAPSGQLTVVVARALDGIGEATRVVAGLLAVGIPPLLALVAATTWTVVGRALAPVEAIRGEVDEISAAELHRRVPDPPGSDEIARLASTMNRMLARLERAHARQRRFVADAAHELRSPVASIRQHAEVALAHPERSPTGELAATVLAEDLRIQRLVEDLLLLAYADEHTLRLRRRPVDLDDLVLDEARQLRDGTGLGVDTTAVSAGRIDGDAAGLRRVLRNLGDNAARHARARIAFTLAERDGTVVLAVDDDGPGIPEADRERVLERFVRLDDARSRDAGGSGLGLAIVNQLVAAHAGTISIAGSPLGGARVEVSLPASGLVTGRRDHGQAKPG
jgi:signal transduction histidine kinase